MVLKALTTFAPGTCCWSSSAADTPLVVRSLQLSSSGFVASTTTLPSSVGPSGQDGGVPAATRAAARLRRRRLLR
jgi:hypothetical protein